MVIGPLFCLEPTNDEAKELVRDHRMRNPFDNLVCNGFGVESIGIGHTPSKADGYILAVLGRSGRRSDVQIPRKISRKYISRVHCTFEIDHKTGVIYICDGNGESRSSGGRSPTLRLGGSNSHGFLNGRAVLLPDLNTELFIGAEGFGELRFKLIWDEDRAKVLEYGSRLSKIIEPPSRSVFSFASASRSTSYDSSAMKTNLAWAEIKELATGSSTRLVKAVDVHSGRMMAVKILQDPFRNNYKVPSLTKEVKILQKAKHPCIVELISSRGWGNGPIEIFYQHFEENFADVIYALDQEQGGKLILQDICRAVLHDILEALVYIHGFGIIHNQIEPRNIYLSIDGDRCRFYLGNFGLSTMEKDSEHVVDATMLYMAPECFEKKPKTVAVDIWALYVTVIHAMDEIFRANTRHERDYAKICEAIQGVVNGGDKLFGDSKATGLRLSHLKLMAHPNAGQRATAAHMLQEVIELDRDSIHGQRIHDSTSITDPDPPAKRKTLLQRLVGYATKRE
ncbi:unnamed protein product [Clonostachys rosea]|uniref:non-specific serine/threonine protein kinase n=1 Tax=Bionectria ochroleuca TaxID=29856 RepID=A0ABY6UN67_BIOOC|nr:unnamed protein product [Clonostachys rosea]